MKNYTLKLLKSVRAGRAFTLLEIMLVVMIIALLAGAAIFLMRRNVDIARIERARNDIETIKTQLQYYEVSNGTLPSTEQGLQALVQKPNGDPQPRRWMSLLPSIPLDPWGSPYQYRFPSAKNSLDGYDLFTAAKDKQAATDDDFGNW
jgi:general secretion pathway protein G